MAFVLISCCLFLCFSFQTPPSPTNSDYSGTSSRVCSKFPFVCSATNLHRLRSANEDKHFRAFPSPVCSSAMCIIGKYKSRAAKGCSDFQIFKELNPHTATCLALPTLSCQNIRAMLFRRLYISITDMSDTVYFNDVNIKISCKITTVLLLGRLAKHDRVVG